VKKKSPKIQNLDLKDESGVWELNVPSHEVTKKENIISKNSIKHFFLTKRPPYLLLCKETLTCTPSDKSESKVVHSNQEASKTARSKIHDFSYLCRPSRPTPHQTWLTWKPTKMDWFFCLLKLKNF